MFCCPTSDEGFVACSSKSKAPPSPSREADDQDTGLACEEEQCCPDLEMVILLNLCPGCEALRADVPQPTFDQVPRCKTT
mmetsp:Transcript_576/g.972  ORF Transcript_576/g.972 Transcript_576/m.972 type:complete len:80 (+) Transcript_576:807-1046(+)